MGAIEGVGFGRSWILALTETMVLQLQFWSI